MSNRWTQADGDRARLPEGVKRVGYDTDTSQYTFLDRKGTMYKSEPGSEYGKLSPVQDPIQQFEQERPQAFSTPGVPADDDDDAPRFAPTTFEQFVPRRLITSPKNGPDDPPESKSKIRRKLTLRSSSSKSGSPSSSSSQSKRDSSSSYPTKDYPTSAPPGTLRFKDAIRRSGLPKMQGVVEGLRRSMTGSRRSGGGHGRSKSESGSGLLDAQYAELVDMEKK